MTSDREQARHLRRSATLLRGQGEYRAAELAGMRELAIWRRWEDPAGAIDALHHLADTFRARDRMHRVIDCADQILTWSVRHDDPVAVPRALRNLGLVYREAGQPHRAIDYLTRARAGLDALPDIPATYRAELLAQLGHALWTSAAQPTARRRFRDALALTIQADPDTADRVRQLLDTPPGMALPASALDGLDSIEIHRTPPGDPTGTEGQPPQASMEVAGAQVRQ